MDREPIRVLIADQPVFRDGLASAGSAAGIQTRRGPRSDQGSG
jgi:hypothetical protein